MSWIQIRPPAKQSSGPARLSITPRQRRGKTEPWARLNLDAAVLQQLALAPGDHVALFCGQDEDCGKIALRGVERGPDSFRLTRHGQGARLTFAADLLGFEAALAAGTYRLTCHVTEGLLTLTLPQHATPDPVLPGAEAGTPMAAAAALRTVAPMTVRMTREPSAERDGPSRPAQRPRHKEVWTEEEDRELCRMRQAGLSAATIAAALGRTPAAVAIRASALQLPQKAREAARIIARQPGRPASPAGTPGVAEALAWLRWEGGVIQALDDGCFCIAGERVTPRRLVQIANNKRVRRSPPLPPFPLPSPDPADPLAGPPRPEPVSL